MATTVAAGALTGCARERSPAERSAAGLAALKAPSPSWTVEDLAGPEAVLRGPSSGDGPPPAVLRVGGALVHLEPPEDPTSAMVAWRRTVSGPDLPQACAELRAWAQRAETRFGLDAEPRQLEEACHDLVGQAPGSGELSILGSGATAYAAVPDGQGRQRHLLWVGVRADSASGSAAEPAPYTLIAAAAFDHEAP